MSVPKHKVGRPRDCPRCSASVASERHESEQGVTWLWRCPCGWSGALTESGVLRRSTVLGAISGDDDAQE